MLLKWPGEPFDLWMELWETAGMILGFSGLVRPRAVAVGGTDSRAGQERRKCQGALMALAHRVCDRGAGF